MFQLYRDGLEDLLKDVGKKKAGEDDKKPPSLKITLAEHSITGLVQVEGAACLTATAPGEVMNIFAKGSARRTTASTQMNAESSRSHLICSLTVKLTNKRSGKESVGKLTLVDLAGSEVKLMNFFQNVSLLINETLFDHCFKKLIQFLSHLILRVGY
jgi:hypothetical protein